MNKELQRLKSNISRGRHYLKNKIIKYRWNSIYYETPYTEMPYEMRINHKGYNKIVANMDRLACEILKLKV